MKIIQTIALMLLVALPLSATKYAGEIFAISPGAQASAMGGTGLTNSEAFSLGWWNPALLALNPEPGLELMRSQHFEGLMDQNQLSLLLGKMNSSSLIINHLVIDDVKLTKIPHPDQPIGPDNRPYVWKTVSNQDFILYGGIARSIKPKLHVGLSPKIAYRSLAEHSGYAFGADLGMLWELGSKARLGANFRDFFSTQIFWEDSEHELVIPNLDLEFGLDLQALKKYPLHLAFRSELRAEDVDAKVKMGPLSADLHAGMAISPIPALKVMAGFDVDAFTAGMGIKYKVFGINYAFRSSSPEGLGHSQRLSATYQW